MWGNRLGWGISSGIVVVAMFLAYWLYTLGQPTPPTGWVAATVRPLALDGPARAALPAVDPAGDAGPLYRDAIDDYHAHPVDYDRLLKTKDYNRDAFARLKGLQDLVDAAARPDMALFRSRPEEVVNYDPTVPALDDLSAVANVAGNAVALAAYDKDYATARKYAAAVLALGRHLYDERLTYDELSAGLSLMGSGSAALQQVADRAGDKPTAAAQKAFNDARLAENAQAVEPVWRVVSGQGEANIRDHAGDFFQLAADAAADPVWRVEAIRRLGRLQRNAETRADNVRAARVLRQLAGDASLDPVLHQAAVSGRDITAYQNQSQR